MSGEHVKHADILLANRLCKFFNVCLSHGYFPSDFMKTVIAPIVKDKKGLLTNKDNYRPVAVTTVMSKVFEILLLSRISDKLDTQPNQFGFKKKHNTEFCVFSLKEVIDFYIRNSSPVYIVFLDASKAFDRINFWILFRKMIKRQVNALVVRILVYWYNFQLFCVRWNNVLSGFFNVSNGVRQGGITYSTCIWIILVHVLTRVKLAAQLIMCQ